MNNEILAKQIWLKTNEKRLHSLDTEVVEDTIGNLVYQHTDAYNNVCSELETLGEQYYKESFEALGTEAQSLVVGDFAAQLEEYVSYLIANRDDLTLYDEIKDVLMEFPHLAPRFE